jgi:predicted flap endonuclease-1-like 5' DNA nuclease
MANRFEVEPGPESRAGHEPVTGIRPTMQSQDRDASTETEELELEPEPPDEPVTDMRVRVRVNAARPSLPPPPPPPSAVSTARPSGPPRSVRELREALRGQARVPGQPASSAPAAAPDTPASTPTSATPPPLAGALSSEIQRLRKQLREREARLSELEAILDQRAEALISAETREGQLLARVTELEARIDALETSPRVGEGDGLGVSVANAAAHVELDARTDALEARPSDGERDLSLIIAAARADAELALDAGSLPPESAATPAAIEPRALTTDDLRLIRGIGPGYQRALVALGVQSFASIAAWTDEDIVKVSRELGIKPGRIQRDRWIEQARALADVGTVNS